MNGTRNQDYYEMIACAVFFCEERNQAMNDKILNETLSQIAELNAVEGFNPELYACELPAQNGKLPRKN